MRNIAAFILLTILSANVFASDKERQVVQPTRQPSVGPSKPIHISLVTLTEAQIGEPIIIKRIVEAKANHFIAVLEKVTSATWIANIRLPESSIQTKFSQVASERKIRYTLSKCKVVAEYKETNAILIIDPQDAGGQITKSEAAECINEAYDKGLNNPSNRTYYLLSVLL